VSPHHFRALVRRHVIRTTIARIKREHGPDSLELFALIYTLSKTAEGCRRRLIREGGWPGLTRQDVRWRADYLRGLGVRLKTL
jgi:hypothetical protein